MTNTNWEGGRILVNPLDACVEGDVAYGEPQHVVATNRYWYSWDLQLPAGATVSLDDALNADSVGDFLLTGLYYHLFHATLIPGHSSAQFTIPGNPDGQTLTQSAIADPVSYVVNTIITGLTIASLGELQVERAALKAAEDALWEGVERGVDDAASIAAKTARGSNWRITEDAKIASSHKDDSNLIKALNSFYDSMSVASCIVEALQDKLPANDFTSDSALDWSYLSDMFQAGIEKCKVEIVAAVIGAGVKWAIAKNEAEIAEELVKSLGDPKALQSGIEGAAAAVALENGGKDYFRSKLIFTQAKDPRSVPSEPSCPSLQVGQCADLPDACDQSATAPAVDSDEAAALQAALDSYSNGPHDASDPVSVCGQHSLLVTYADPSSPKSQRIDVQTYDSATKQWTRIQTFDPHDTQQPNGQPYIPFDASGSFCHGRCIQEAPVTDGDVDFLVQGANSTLDNGLTVVSVRDGKWRMVPFLKKPDLSGTPAAGSTPYVPAASLVGNEIHVDLNDCKPSCANGQHSTLVYTYQKDKQGFDVAAGSSSLDSSPGPGMQTQTVPVFVTPSNNIMCGKTGKQVLCFIKSHDFATGTCDIGQPGFTLYLNPTGSATVSACANDASIAFSPEAVTVTYGTTVDFADIGSCSIAETGVTCTNNEGHGFTLSKSSHSEF